MAVASTIAGCGLGDFYRLRDGTQNQAEWQADQYLYLDHPDFKHEGLIRGDLSSSLSVSLVGLSCAACVWLIEKYLLKEVGVTKVRVNQVSQRAFIEYDPIVTKPSEIMQAIAALGYQASLDRGLERSKLLKQEQKKSLMRLGVAAIGMMQVGMYAIALHAGSMQGISELERDLMRHAALIVCTLIVFYSARPFFQSAWSALKHKSLVMDVPVSIAILAAYGASLWSTIGSGAGGTNSGEVYFDSVAMFTFFLLLSRFLEAQARAKLDVQPVQSLIPNTATISDASGNQIAEIATTQLAVGDSVLVEPGSAVPADLKILSGLGEVDESILSGEFSPVPRGVGDELVAGSLNGEGRFVGEVVRLNQDSSLALIDRLYEGALQLRSASEELADRLAGWFVAVVLGAALITYLAWLWFDPDKAFWIMLSVLVVSCPCALSLATPTSITAAMFGLRSRGILVRHSKVLDQLKGVTDVIFDKTGTLTEGRPKIQRIEVVGNLSEDECMAIAGALESHSSHPFAKAFVLPDSGIEAAVEEVIEDVMEEVRVVPGSGVEGRWQGRELKIGNRAFVQILNDADLGSDPNSNDYIPIYLAVGSELKSAPESEFELLAIFYIEDPVRASAEQAMEELSARGLNLHLLSGDPSLQPQRVAEKLGLSNWKNHCSATDKLEYIVHLKGVGKNVLFVGDGINDVPAMGAADISLVVAQAPDLVQSRADIGLVVSDLRLINQLLDQSRRLSGVLRQNVTWAIIYNLGAIPAAAMGFIAPWLAAIGMSFSSTIVVLNALRLKRLRNTGNAENIGNRENTKQMKSTDG